MPKNMLSERIESRILLVRGQKVMIDRDLAELYGVTTSALNQAVNRNLERFPPDFMFRLSRKQTQILVSQSVIPSLRSLGGRLPHAFTEEGVAMLSSVLRSDRAIRVNIEIMRAFMRLKRALGSNAELARKLDEVEKKCSDRHGLVLKEIRKLILPDPDAPPVKIRPVK